MPARFSVKNSHIEDDLILVLKKQTPTVKVITVRLRVVLTEMVLTGLAFLTESRCYWNSFLLYSYVLLKLFLLELFSLKSFLLKVGCHWNSLLFSYILQTIIVLKLFLMDWCFLLQFCCHLLKLVLTARICRTELNLTEIVLTGLMFLIEIRFLLC
jgi:hypothetical protein